MLACRLSMSSTRKTYIAPAYSWLREAVDAGAGVVEAAAAVAAQEVAVAAQEVAVAAQEAAEAAAAVVAAGAAAYGLDLSGSARTRAVRTRATPNARFPAALVVRAFLQA
jgi:hypothetical protein